MRLALSLLLLAALSTTARAEQLDLVTYSAPKGFKREATDSAMKYTRVTKDRYCILGIYKSRAGGNDPAVELDAEWKALVASAGTVVGTPSIQNGDARQGYAVRVAGAQLKTTAGDTAAMLVTFVGFGRVTSALILTNDPACPDDLAPVLDKLELARPAATTPPSPSPTKPSATTITGNFDDGWTAQRLEDRVLVTKGDVKVSLFYAVAMTEQMRPPVTKTSDYFWNTYVVPRFDVKTATNRDANYMGLKPDFIEGEVREKGTTTSRYAAINVSYDGAAATLVLVTTPNKADFDRLFPDPNDLLKMTFYNRFAPVASEIVGTWSDSSTAAASLYDVNTGNNVGTTAVARSAVFTFKGDGTYESIHNGATGRVGNMSTFQQHYKGTYKLDGFKLTATKRFNGQTATFTTHRRATRTGWILFLDDGRGSSFTLAKTK